MLYKFIRIIFSYIYSFAHIFNTNKIVNKGEVIQLYDINICKVRYSLFSYKIERIKGIIKPIYISRMLHNKIVRDINDNILNKKYKIIRLKRNESILLYEDNELVNNTLNNIIIYNTTLRDDTEKYQKIMSY